MSWVRLDDQFPDHPKVASLSNDAFCLHVTAMCWTAKQQTDGQLPCGLLRRLAWRCHDPAMAIAELVASGVWDVDGEDGWKIHDFLDYNPSKAETEALAETRSVAGKVGAAARWQTDSKSHGKSDGKSDGKIMPPSPSPLHSFNGDDTPATYPTGFDEFERNFRINLLNAVKERDPRQSMAGGFSLSDSSRAALVQVVNGGPVLTAKAIDWALDQWETAKPNQTFRLADTGCVNWLLTTINNSYRPAGKTNGQTATTSAPLKAAGRAAQAASERSAAGIAALALQGVTEDDPLFYPKLNAWIEGTYGK